MSERIEFEYSDRERTRRRMTANGSNLTLGHHVGRDAVGILADGRCVALVRFPKRKTSTVWTTITAPRDVEICRAELVAPEQYGTRPGKEIPPDTVDPGLLQLFVESVGKLRRSQKAFNESRKSRTLNQVKQLERVVDKLLVKINDQIKETKKAG